MELYHHGILGQKWGIRRYQNPDGTLTAAGKARYGTDVTKMKEKDFIRQYNASSDSGRLKNVSRIDNKIAKEFEKTEEYKAQRVMAKYLEKAQDQLYKEHGPNARLVLTGFDAMFYNEVNTKAAEKKKQIARKYIEKAASAALKDMEYENTEAGREYVKRIMSKYL